MLTYFHNRQQTATTTTTGDKWFFPAKAGDTKALHFNNIYKIAKLQQIHCTDQHQSNKHLNFNTGLGPSIWIAWTWKDQ